MKVEQYKHANQFHLYKKQAGVNIDILQSYDSTVIIIENDDTEHTKTIILGRYWNYSNTTAKHVYEFLEEFGGIYFTGITNKKAYIQKLIDSGTIQYDDKML